MLSDLGLCLSGSWSWAGAGCSAPGPLPAARHLLSPIACLCTESQSDKNLLGRRIKGNSQAKSQPPLQKQERILKQKIKASTFSLIWNFPQVYNLIGEGMFYQEIVPVGKGRRWIMQNSPRLLMVLLKCACHLSGKWSVLSKRHFAPSEGFALNLV